MAAMCPKCGEVAVEFEEVEGVSACGACGWVVAGEELVHSTNFDGQGLPAGLFVGATDTGERAAAYALQASGMGLAIQRSRQGGGEAKLQARVREFGALLRLQSSVLEQALHVGEQAMARSSGGWRRDQLAAAAAYAACRLNKLPITLADLSAATQVAPHTLGHHYCALCRLLDLQPPPLLPADLLPRSLDRVAAEAVRQGLLAAGTMAAVQRDASMLLGWMQRELERRQFPMAAVGAAIVLAAEINTVSLSLEHVSASLPLARSTLEAKLSQVRRHLVRLGAFLPYSAGITTRNVGSHARTIIQLSALVGGAARAGSGPGGQPAGSAEPGATQPSHEEQPVGDGGGAAAAARSGNAGVEEQEVAQRHKRARMQGPGSFAQDATAAKDEQAGVMSGHEELQQQQAAPG